MPRYFRFRALIVFCALLIPIVGCQKKLQEFREKAPRPVSVLPLQQSKPDSAFVVSGLVKSWKTEKIGFEVAGRLQWVLEPGRNIDGNLRDSQGVLIRKGTPLAKIDTERFDVAVKSAKAALDVATSEMKVAEIKKDTTIPKDIETAKEDVKLAQTNFDRLKSLRAQNAVSQTEFDNASNQLKNQQARLSNLEASLRQANAEFEAAEARVNSAKQTLADAERDQKNTTLYASYNGQISEVDVVPGSVVTSGSPILTLQMMDPIKVEIEVSAELSRELQRRRQVPVSFTLPDGTTKEQNAFVYLVDPSADASTRTFTVTLLIINDDYRPALPEAIRSERLARTQDAWPLNIGQIIGEDGGHFFVEQGAIVTEGDSSYVWVIQNLSFGETFPEIVKVKREKVILGQVLIPFLGNWNFQQLTFENKSIKPTNIIAGKLEFTDIPKSEWDGETVYIDSGNQWMLRPGDLVSANIDAEQTKPGFYVPVEAIYEDIGSTYVFVDDNGKAKKTEINAILPTKLETGSMIRIEATGDNQLTAGMRIVVGGVHYLNDGDAINVVKVLTGKGGQK